MELPMPKFIVEGYEYYDNEGIKIKEDAPQWAKDEYKEFMKQLNNNKVE